MTYVSARSFCCHSLAVSLALLLLLLSAIGNLYNSSHSNTMAPAQKESASVGKLVRRERSIDGRELESLHVVLRSASQQCIGS